MVRAGGYILLAGESPVRASAGAPGSRPQAGREIAGPERGVESPPWVEGKEAGRNESERCSHVIVSAERCLGGPSRSCHGEGNRQQRGSRRLLNRSEEHTSELQ